MPVKLSTLIPCEEYKRLLLVERLAFLETLNGKAYLVRCEEYLRLRLIEKKSKFFFPAHFQCNEKHIIFDQNKLKKIRRNPVRQCRKN